MTWTTNTGKHLIIIVNFVLIAAFISRFYFDKVLSDLNDSIKVKAEILKQNSKFESDYNRIRNKIIAIKTLSGTEKVLSNLQDIISVTPDGVKFSSLTYTANTISFQASIPTKEVFNTLINNLKSMQFVKSINISRVEKQKGNDPGIDSFFILKTI